MTPITPITPEDTRRDDAIAMVARYGATGAVLVCLQRVRDAEQDRDDAYDRLRRLERELGEIKARHTP